MQYLGGKSRIAKEIAEVVAPKGVWWEPFCGGLYVSVQLAKYGPGVVSDANPALITLYQAVRHGWQPPASVSREEYQAAKSLPDSDPHKAFIGFGCSFGGKWFGGYAENKRRWHNTQHHWVNDDYAGAARRAVLRDIRQLEQCSIACLSFFDIDPATAPAPECIYADPPYAGTTGYNAVGAFDHAKFWAYCGMWAARGVRVFVSEYNCPAKAEIIWENSAHCIRTARTTNTAKTTERLFLIKPA